MCMAAPQAARDGLGKKADCLGQPTPEEPASSTPFFIKSLEGPEHFLFGHGCQLGAHGWQMALIDNFIESGTGTHGPVE